MFYRAFATGVVLFWLLMGALLVRTEFFANQTNLLPVPVDYVGRLMFRHEQVSDLALYSQHRRLDGTFHLQPRRLPAHSDGKDGPLNLLSGSGNFSLSLPGMANQRVIFRGVLEFDERQQVQRVELSASFHEPKQTTAGLSVRLDGDPASGRWHYQIQQSGVTIREGTGTPAELLENADLPALGIDPKAFSQMSQQVTTTVTAHRGTLQMNNEAIETYVVTIHHGASLETTIHLNQLGQVLAVKTFLDYELYDEALVP